MKKDVAISKLRIKKVLRDKIRSKPAENFAEVVYKYLCSCYEEPFVNDTVNEFDYLKNYEHAGKKIYYCRCHIKYSQKSVANNTDENNGEIWFVFWDSNSDDIVIYCFLRSLRSNAWNVIGNERDFEFPNLFAKTFLDPDRIMKIVIRSLIGTDRDRQTRWFKENTFQQSFVTERFGFVELLVAKFADTDECIALLEHLDVKDRKTFPVTKQQGQIKLQVGVKNKDFDPEPYIGMLMFIEETIRTKYETIKDDLRWRFIDYLKEDNHSRQFDEKIKKSLVQYFKEGKESPLFDPETILMYKHQDAFDSSNVKLIFNEEEVSWATGDETLKGSVIRIKDVFDALRKDSIKLESVKDIDNIKLRFYDQDAVEEALISLVMSVDREMDEQYTIIKHGKKTFKVQIESYYEEFYRFVKAAKRCYLPRKDSNLPEILPWKFPKWPTFTINELYEFCVHEHKNRLNDEINEKLVMIFTKETQLFLDNGENNILRECDDINNILMHGNGDIVNNTNGNETANPSTDIKEEDSLLKAKDVAKDGEPIVQNYQDSLSPSQEENLYSHSFPEDENIDDEKPDASHSQQILMLNRALIKKSDIQKDMGELYSSKIEIENVLNQDCLKEDDPSLKTLCEKRQIIKAVEGEQNNRFFVSTPHLTKEIWYEISKVCPEICPVRLVQFLRMNIGLADEGDYNELYHLSNCPCKANGWKFVVGDRILNRSNHNIELFDVMAIKNNKAFYLHVKHKFDGEAARNLCSQVRVGIKCLWDTLMGHTKENMLEKFYDVAKSASKKDSSIHKQLTSLEIDFTPDNSENTANKSETKEIFSKMLRANKMKHYVCLVPRVGSQTSFRELLGCQLDYVFTVSDFSKIDDPYAALVKVGLLNDSGRLMPSFFNITSEGAFRKKLGLEFKESYKDLYKTLKRKIYKSKIVKGNALTKSDSFVAKSEFVALYDYHSKYRPVHGVKDPISLKIIELTQTYPTKSKKDKTESSEQEPKQTDTTIGATKATWTIRVADPTKTMPNKTTKGAAKAPAKKRKQNETNNNNTKITNFFKPPDKQICDHKKL